MKMNENVEHKNSAVSCFYEGNTFTLEVQLSRVLVRRARVEIQRRFA